MSLFKKSNRKFRQRTKHDDSDEERSEATETPAVVLCDKIANQPDVRLTDDDDFRKKPIEKTIPKLSFHDDEEEGFSDIKIKKSAYSRRLSKKWEKEKQRKRERGSKEEKSEEVKQEKQEVVEKDELNVVWLDSKINQPKDEVKILSSYDLEDEEEDSADERGDGEQPFHQFQSALKRGVIPDAKTIYALKKQRQMAKAAEEFIALEEDQRFEEEEDSRLIRDDENDRSDDDYEDDRISFTVNKLEEEKERIKESIYLAQEESDEDSKEGSDDELDKWEREQIKKGVGMPSVARLQEQMNSGTLRTNNIDKKEEKSKKAVVPSYILSKMKKKITIGDICDNLNVKLNSLIESYESHKRQILSLNVEMEEVKVLIEKYTKQLQEKDDDEVESEK